MKTRKVPLRKCLGCNEQKDKRELIRVVKNKDGEIFMDLTGKANGRGAYICKSLECYEKAYKRKALERALQTKIEEEVYESMRKELEDAK
ncbi:YlxR family protein [Acidaminobacter sp. JC074]|uniref:RNase P modulator RnpM n=1 Tax=Acidaminobacter sp. JC074 TaxID=2530199 RepID=UPI001F0F4728|nr:YlxR family protein [Acidaminobacter sp. JC074]MCH4890907.1 YlxR family protein [Acidaminobacter sp. JC074]